jgi:hypothetical protein
LPDVSIDSVDVQPGKSVRFDWTDGASRVTVSLDFVTANRTQVVVQHTRIRDGSTADRLKSFWRERLNALKREVERGS